MIDRIIKDALLEDMPSGDITSDSIFNKDNFYDARLIVKEDGIISGIDIFERTFEIVDNTIELSFYVKNGDKVTSGQKIADIKGNSLNILKAERVALNILQRMSGVATLTNKFVTEIAGECKILDTRKTTPNLRVFEKRAVLDGGGFNHRFSLSDQVMIKDNHIKAAGSIEKAYNLVKNNVDSNIKIEIEVENLEMYKEALKLKPDIIMLDNMSNEDMKKAVDLNNDKNIKLEASGNMTIKRINSVSKTGVDFISVGALTHSYKSLDISLKF